VLYLWVEESNLKAHFCMLKNEDAPHCIDVTDLYDSYHAKFKNWARWQFPIYDSHVHEDVFHDALIVYWENCQKGKFQNLQVPLINLIIGIGHNLYRKRGAKKDLEFLETMPESEATIVRSVLESITEAEIAAETQQWLTTGFEQLGAECQRLLTLFYCESKKIPEIVTLLNYKNDNVASAIKSRCLKTLKTNLENHGRNK
jgi:RNA polymerase sigma factor (sigma-70 family)